MRRIALPLPLALRSINAYLIEGSSGYALVDAGMHTREAEAALRAALAEAGVAIEDVRRVFVTHLHPDHIGMAGTLERAGAEVVMHGPELANASRMWSRDHAMVDETYRWFERHGMPRDVDEDMRRSWLEIGRAVDEVERVTPAADGDELDLGGRRARLKWTPGHTDYHAVLVDGAERVLFAGDHVLPRITSNVGLYPFSRDDPLGDFLDALRAVRPLPVTRVLPAHGDPFDDLPGRVDQILAHHEQRLQATLDALGDSERNAYAVCRLLFPVLRSAHEERFALAETLAHLRYLERRGKVHEINGLPARWAVP
ncbi:MAG TPA: MBL fold metallo-hydrolase [Candidatus Limnocylindria bacterium]|nr:MBL fold metallo-hydrolase [Candidatus Limnocylindria bacterium]